MRYEYNKCTFRQYLTISDIHEPLSFIPCLVKLMIDNPDVENKEISFKEYENSFMGRK